MASEKATQVAKSDEAFMAETDWAQVAWQTVVQETGDQIVFDKVGDVFVGLYTGTQTGTKDGEEFKILTFTGVDGKPYQTNAGWKLEQGFSDIPSNTIVRVTYVKDIDTGQPSPMKDFRIDVATRPQG